MNLTLCGAYALNVSIVCIHTGRRKETRPVGVRPPVELFQVRANGGPICTRCVQITPEASNLNSEFCFILRVPFDGEEESGIVYVWVGNRADPEEARLTEEIADDMYGVSVNGC